MWCVNQIKFDCDHGDLLIGSLFLFKFSGNLIIKHKSIIIVGNKNLRGKSKVWKVIFIIIIRRKRKKIQSAIINLQTTKS